MDRLKSKIHEVIVTTMTTDGQSHHAPMGISEVNGHFLIKPFKPSATYDNLKRSGQCCINYIDDVRVFAGALTGHRQWPTSPCEIIDGQYLTHALAHSELQVIDIDDAAPRACFTAAVKHESNHAPFRGFNRAQSAVVEAAILVSRLQMLSADKIRGELAYLAIAIDKTAGEHELEAWGWLMAKIREAGIEI